MKLLALFIITVASTFTLAAEADINRDCRLAYREATVGLMNSIEEYNSHLNQSSEIQQQAKKYLVVSVAAIDAELGAKRAFCYFAEDAANKDCVSGYKKIYSDIRSRMNLIAVAAGNQEEVDLGFLDSLGLHLRLGGLDLQCR